MTHTLRQLSRFGIYASIENFEQCANRGAFSSGASSALATTVRTLTVSVLGLILTLFFDQIREVP